ncbi:MAG: hypothetical protein LH613_10875 [Chamaesiphon sp.]|nr:hypothetical protein [Chamaesiphon sp.]
MRSVLLFSLRKLSDDLIYSNPDPNSDPEQVAYVYATFDDLHESAKKRWCSINTYRPEGLKVFEARLNGWCK